MPKHDTHADTIEEVKPASAEAPATPERERGETAGHAVEPITVVNMEYDTPPKEWVAGTAVPKDTDPADMSDAEYIQYCYDNLMPFWAIKKEIYLRKPPVLSGLEPSTVEIGSASFDLHVSGTGLIQDSVIVFAGQDEPTQLNADGTVSTGVRMDLWHGPATVPVCVRNGTQVSEPLEFTFTAPAGGERKAFEDYPPQREQDHDHDRDEDDDDRDDDGKPAKKAKKKK